MTLSRSLAEKAGCEWIARFNAPDSDLFAELYSENGSYVDPAFGIVRQGKDFIRLLHRRWRGAISGFKMEVERLVVADRVTIVQYTAVGRFDGSPLGSEQRPLQPTGKSFRARGVVVLVLTEEGLIETSTDYYDRLIMPNGEDPPIADDSVLPPPPPRG